MLDIDWTCMLQKKISGEAFRGKSIKFVVIWEILVLILLRKIIKLILKKDLHKSALYYLQQQLKSTEDFPFVGVERNSPRYSKVY